MTRRRPILTTLCAAFGVTAPAWSEASQDQDATLSSNDDSPRVSSEVDSSEADSSQLVHHGHRTSWTGDRLALLAHFGIAPPGGVIGADLDLAPIRWFAVNVTGGLGVAGLQLGVTPRVRIELGRPQVLLGFGSGISFGRYVTSTANAGLACASLCALEANGESPAALRWNRAYWHNIEASVDLYPSQGRTMFHFALGYGYILNRGDKICLDADKPSNQFGTNQGCDRDTGQSLVYTSAAIGFDI